MQLAPILSRLIGIFAVLSLVIAPMAMPSHASAASARAATSAAHKPMAHMAMSHMGMSHMGMSHMGMSHMGKSGMAAAAAMANVVPCCPDENRGPADDCGTSCPMALLCMAKLLPAPPLAKDFVPTRIAALIMQVPHDDMWRDLLPDPPPLEPPRS